MSFTERGQQCNAMQCRGEAGTGQIACVSMCVSVFFFFFFAHMHELLFVPSAILAPVQPVCVLHTVRLNGGLRGPDLRSHRPPLAQTHRPGSASVLACKKECALGSMYACVCVCVCACAFAG